MWLENLGLKEVRVGRGGVDTGKQGFSKLRKTTPGKGSSGFAAYAMC